MSKLKKIGVLFGQERTFPEAFIEAINSKSPAGIVAEKLEMERVLQGEASGYAVIIDRISQDVPFYRAYLKNAALSGTAILNNPFWWSADDKFFNNAVAVKIGVPVPNTLLLPSSQMPDGTTGESFMNLEKLNWEGFHDEIGYPAYMKPFAGGGGHDVYKLNSKEDFFVHHPKTGKLVMLLQEGIEFTDYYRCYCIDRKDVRIMEYDPTQPYLQNYVHGKMSQDKKLLATIKEYVLRLNKALGYDINTAEFAIKDGIPYAIDFGNPAPDADLNSVGQENFEWFIEKVSALALKRARAYKEGKMNLTWGDFVTNSVGGEGLVASSDDTEPKPKKTPVKRKPATKKATTKKTTATTTTAKSETKEA